MIYMPMMSVCKFLTTTLNTISVLHIKLKALFLGHINTKGVRNITVCTKSHLDHKQ